MGCGLATQILWTENFVDISISLVARTPTRKRFAQRHSTVYECLKTLFDTLAFLKRANTLSTNASRSLGHFFDTVAFFFSLAFRHARVRFKTRVFAHLRRGKWHSERDSEQRPSQRFSQRPPQRPQNLSEPLRAVAPYSCCPFIRVRF